MTWKRSAPPSAARGASAILGGVTGRQVGLWRFGSWSAAISPLTVRSSTPSTSESASGWSSNPARSSWRISAGADASISTRTILPKRRCRNSSSIAARRSSASPSSTSMSASRVMRNAYAPISSCPTKSWSMWARIRSSKRMARPSPICTSPPGSGAL